MLTSIFIIIVLLALLAAVYWIGKWAIGELALPEPMARVANVVLVLLVLAALLLYIIPKALALFGVNLG